MNVYLDVNGVILTHELKEAPYLIDFLKKLESYDTYWLTTHCRDGDSQNVLRYLSDKISPEALELLRNVKGTKWSVLKTEAIDFESDFIWLEDSPLQSEQEAIAKADKEGSLLIIDLKNNPYQLKEIADQILES